MFKISCKVASLIKSKMTTAELDIDYSGMMDSWRCSNCGGLTYDIHEFEIPRFCCRCGQKFDQHDYKDKLPKGATTK